MGKFMKPGKVVMVLAGRYAGRKAVIVKVRSGCVLCLIVVSCCVLTTPSLPSLNFRTSMTAPPTGRTATLWSPASTATPAKWPPPWARRRSPSGPRSRPSSRCSTTTTWCPPGERCSTLMLLLTGCQTVNRDTVNCKTTCGSKWKFLVDGFRAFSVIILCCCVRFLTEPHRFPDNWLLLFLMPKLLLDVWSWQT